MKEDIFFVFDEEWEQQEKELKQILREIKEPEVYKNAYVLGNFVRACSYAFVKKTPKSFLKFEKPEILGEEITKPKYYQRVVNIPAGVEVYPVPAPSTEEYIQPVHTFRQIPVYTKKTVIEPMKPEKKKSKISGEVKKDLIVDKITSKVLASSRVNKDYYLIEPRLSREDVEVLEKVKKKKIKDMDEGWKLIQKYGKKLKIEKGHDTLIKYYVVNDIFGMGQIEGFLHDDRIDAIFCKAPNKFLEVKIGKALYRTNIRMNREDLKSFTYGFAERVGEKFSHKVTALETDVRGWHFSLRADKLSFVVKRK